MRKTTKKLLSRYTSDDRGQFAVWFAVAALPLILGASMVIELQRTAKDGASVKNALDAAVLAAVSNQGLSNAQTANYAKKVFNENYLGEADLNLEVFPQEAKVRMIAEGSVSTLFGELVGRKDMPVNVASTAVMDRNNTICVLAMASNLEHSIRFIEGADFTGLNCSVQTNSNHDQALLSASLTVPRANAFCSAGGAAGTFFPTVRSQCTPVTDPFTNVVAPPPGQCMPSTYFNPVHVDDLGSNPPGTHDHNHSHGTDGSHTHPHLANRTHHHVRVPMPRLTELGVNASTFSRLQGDYDDKLLSVEESRNYSGNSRVLQPGTYCGGLTIDGQNVTFAPGNYIMLNGPLTFKNGAIARGDGVSFIMNGPNSVLTVETGSTVYVKAPAGGSMAGLAFYQVRNPQTSVYPDGINLIHSGGSLNVVGTVYFPTHAVDIFGDSELGAQSPATSFIAHQVTFSDDMTAVVEVDAARAGLPALQPSSDDGARLIE